MLEAIRLPAPPLTLGEGPLWHPLRKALYFLDIDEGMIYGFQEGEGTVLRIAAHDRVGFIVPWGEHLLAGVRDTLCRVDLTEHTIEPIMNFDFQPHLRFNDGKCDPEGRLWAGVMTFERSRHDTAQCGALYGVDERGVFQTLAPMDIPNGMAWGQSGCFYHTDTATRRIDRYQRADDGKLFGRQTAVELPNDFPDGLCIDAQGMLWVALWGSGRIQRFDPASGEALAQSITLPECNVSCCCFGGEALNTLYITTAQSHDRPGGLYACRTDVLGIPPFSWRGQER